MPLRKLPMPQELMLKALKAESWHRSRAAMWPNIANSLAGLQDRGYVEIDAKHWYQITPAGRDYLKQEENK